MNPYDFVTLTILIVVYVLFRLRFVRITSERRHKKIESLLLTMSLKLPKGVKPAGYDDQNTLTQLGFSCDMESRPIPRKLEIDFVQIEKRNSGSDRRPICLDVDSKSSDSSCVSPKTMRVVRDRVELFSTAVKKRSLSPDSKSVTEFMSKQIKSEVIKPSDESSSTLTQEPREKGKDGWKSVFHDAAKISAASKALVSSTQNAVVTEPSKHRDEVAFSSSESANTVTPEKNVEPKIRYVGICYFIHSVI